MAEQVVTRMDVEGNAAQKVRDLGSAVKGTSKAVEDAQKELERLFQSGKGNAADFDRIIRGSRGAGGGAGGPSVAGSAETDVPRATLDAERRNRLNLQEVFERDRVRFERQQAADQKRQEREEGGAGGAGGGGRDSLNPLAGTPFQRLGSTIFLIHAVGVALDELAKGSQKFAVETQAGRNAFNAYVDALATGVRQAAEGVPILGGFTRALIEFQEAMTGRTEALARQAAALADIGQQTAGNRFAAGLREQGDQQIGGLRRNVADAGIAARVQGGLANRLRGDPALVRFLNPEVERGVPGEFTANEQTGASRQAVLEAQAARQEALARQAQREQEQAAARDRAGRASAAVGPLANEAARAQNDFRAAQQDVDSASAESQQNLLDRQVEAAAKLRDLDAARAEKQAALNNLKESELRTQEAVKASAQAESAVREAQLNVERNRLELLKEEEQVAKSAARQAGASSEGQLQELLAAVQQLKAAGPQTLTPQQRALLQGNAATADFAGKKFEEAGAANPILQQINAEVGRRNLPEIRQERQQVQADLTVTTQINKAQLTKDIADALKDAFGGLKGLIIEIANEAVAAKTDQERQNRLLQQQQK